MGKLKNEALTNRPATKTVHLPVPTMAHNGETDSKLAKVISKPKPKVERTPDRFTYALRQYSVELRKDGWWVTATPFAAAGDKPRWSGPFQTIETACLALARRLATEIADRHTRSIESHKLQPGDVLYGLKLSTRLRAKTSNSLT
jgi:hypothetical protein